MTDDKFENLHKKSKTIDEIIFATPVLPFKEVTEEVLNQEIKTNSML